MHDDISVRLATSDDAALLHSIAAETFPLACPPDALPEAIAEFIATHLSVDAFTGYLRDPQRALFLAQVAGDPAGYAMAVFGEPGDADAAASVTARPTAELSKLYVRERHHGAGVAAALVEASLAEAAARRVRGVWLGVNQQNARANRFYEKSGFVLVGTKKFLVGQRYEDDFVRERLL